MPDPDFAVPAPQVAAGAVAPPSFEQAMAKLEDIVGQMENSKLPLEDLIRCYEEGTRLVKVCNERLAAAEQRIEIITRDAAAEAPLASGSTASAPAAKSTAREPKPTQDPPAPPGRSAKKNNEVSLF